MARVQSSGEALQVDTTSPPAAEARRLVYDPVRDRFVELRSGDTESPPPPESASTASSVGRSLHLVLASSLRHAGIDPDTTTLARFLDALAPGLATLSTADARDLTRLLERAMARGTGAPPPIP